jgi:hypothetical protein
MTNNARWRKVSDSRSGLSTGILGLARLYHSLHKQARVLLRAASPFDALSYTGTYFQQLGGFVPAFLAL